MGVWDGLPKVGNWGFSNSGITLTAAEYEYKYDLIGGALPGKLDAGIVYASPGEISPGRHVPQVYGIYSDWEQMLIREDAGAPDDMQGLGFFLQYISAYEKQDVVFPEYFGAGLIYRGLLPGRDQDTIGGGIAHAHLHLGGTFSELAMEFFYKARLNNRFMIQPDLQYIVSPSGLYPDALVMGVRFEATF